MAPRFVGPFTVLAKRGDLSYQLELPSNFPDVHDVFHVSQLRRCFKDPIRGVDHEVLDLQDDLTYREQSLWTISPSMELFSTISSIILTKFCRDVKRQILFSIGIRGQTHWDVTDYWNIPSCWGSSRHDCSRSYFSTTSDYFLFCVGFDLVDG